MADGKVSIEISAEARAAQKNLTKLSDEFVKTKNEIKEASEALSNFKKEREKLLDGKTREQQVSQISALKKQISEAQSSKKFKTVGELSSILAKKEKQLRDYDTAQKTDDEIKAQNALNLAEEKQRKILESMASTKERIAEIDKKRKDDIDALVKKAVEKEKKKSEDGLAVKSGPVEKAKAYNREAIFEQNRKAREEASKLMQEAERATVKKSDIKTKQKAVEDARISKIREDAMAANPELAELYNRLGFIQSRLKDLSKAGIGKGFKEFDELSQKEKQIKDELKAITSASDETSNSLRNMGSTGKDSVSKIGEYAKKAGSLMLSALGGGIKALFSPFKKLVKSVESFGKRLKTAILQGLVFRQVRTILSKAVQELGKFMLTNSELAQSLSSLKGSFLTAFQPLVDVLAPILIKIINLVQQAVAWISALLSIFGGLSRASNTAAKSMYDQAKAMEAGGGAADKFLASWDTIQKVGDKGGGGGSAAAPTFDFDFGELDFSFAEKIKDLIDGDHWFIVGQTIEEKLNEVLKKMNGWITTEFETFLTSFGKRFATTLNGMLFQSLGSEISLGTVIANFFNSLVRGFNSFLSTFNWNWLGMAIGKNINDFFSTFSFYDAGITFFNLVYGVITTLSNTFATADGTLVGEALGTMLGAIDFGKLLSAFIDFALNAASFLVDAIASAIDPSKGIDLASILQKIIDELTNLDNAKRWSYLAGHMLGSLVRAIINVLKQSKNLQEVAKQMIESLGTAILTGDWSALDRAITALAEGFGEGFVDGVEGRKKVAADAGDSLANETLEATRRGFGGHRGQGGSFAEPEDIGKAVDESLADGIDKNKELVIDMAESIGTATISHLDESLTGDVSSATLKEVGSSIPQNIADGINSNMSPLVAALNNMISYVESACKNVNEGFSTLLGNARSVNAATNGNMQFGTIAPIALPRVALAQGGVVNPGHEFAAVLGDNRYEKEVVSPLSTMKQAFMEALADSGYNRGAGNITLQIDGTTFARITNPYYAKETARIGTKAVGGLAHG